MKLNVKLQKQLHPTVCCVLELTMHQHVPSNKTNSESRHLSWQSVSPTVNRSDIRGVELLLWHLTCLSVCQSQSIPSHCQISLFKISTPDTLYSDWSALLIPQSFQECAGKVGPPQTTPRPIPCTSYHDTSYHSTEWQCG